MSRSDQAIGLAAANLADVRAIAKVWRESFRTADGAPATVWPLSHFQTRVAAVIRGACVVTVAKKGRRIVAFSVADPEARVLRQIFVLPALQGHGVGGRLLEEAMRVMPTGLSLSTAAANRRARLFYESYGLTTESETVHPTRGHLTCNYRWRPV